MTEKPSEAGRSVSAGPSSVRAPAFSITSAVEKFLSFAVETDWKLYDFAIEVLRLAAVSTRATCGALFVYRRDATQMELIAAIDQDRAITPQDAPEWQRSIGLRAAGFEPDGEPLFSVAFRPGEVLIHDSTHLRLLPEYESVRKPLLAAQISSLGIIPLHASGRFMGIMALRGAAGATIRPEALRALLPLSALIALAVEHAQVRASDAQQLIGERAAHGSADARSAARLQALSRTLRVEVAARQRAETIAQAHRLALTRSGAMLVAEPDLDQFLGHVLIAIVEGLDAVSGSIWFLSASRDAPHLHLQCLEGHIVPTVESSESDTREAIADIAAGLLQDPKQWGITRLCTVATEASISEVQRRDLETRGIRHFLMVPLRLGNDVLGWINISLAREVNEDREQLMTFAESLAQHASLAVQLERLAEQARHTAMLEERQRLAREMHDTVAQDIASLVLALRSVTRTLETGDATQAATELRRANDLAERTLRGTREALQALRPRTLERTGFVEALRRLCDDERMGSKLPVSLKIDGKLAPFPPEMELEILRIAQEALTNARRHANASLFSITIEPRGSYVRVAFQDNGKGFEPLMKTDGLGLAVMRERAHRIGAGFTIVSKVQRGTLVEISIPRTAIERQRSSRSRSTP